MIPREVFDVFREVVWTFVLLAAFGSVVVMFARCGGVADPPQGNDDAGACAWECPGDAVACAVAVRVCPDGAP